MDAYNCCQLPVPCCKLVIADSLYQSHLDLSESNL
jgi:hypothetical protein